MKLETQILLQISKAFNAGPTAHGKEILRRMIKHTMMPMQARRWPNVIPDTTAYPVTLMRGDECVEIALRLAVPPVTGQLIDYDGGRPWIVIAEIK